MHPNQYAQKQVKAYLDFESSRRIYSGIRPLSKRTAKVDKVTVHKHMAWKTSRPACGYVKAQVSNITWA